MGRGVILPPYIMPYTLFQSWEGAYYAQNIAARPPPRVFRPTYNPALKGLASIQVDAMEDFF